MGTRPDGSRYPTEHIETGLDARVRILEEAIGRRDRREDEWHDEVRDSFKRLEMAQAMTARDGLDNIRKQGEIDRHFEATDAEVVGHRASIGALEAGHQVLHAKVQAVTRSRRDPKTFWTAIAGAVTAIGLGIDKLIELLRSHP